MDSRRIFAGACGSTAIKMAACVLILGSVSAADEAEDAKAKEQATQIFFNAKLPTPERLAAAGKLGYPDKDTFVRLLELGRDKQQDDRIRWEALQRHPWSKDWVNVVLEILNDPENGGEYLDAKLVSSLSQKTVRLPNAEMRQSIQRTYRQLLDDNRDKVRESAYFVLVATEDSVALAKLVEGLKDGGAKCPVPLNLAIEMVDSAGATRHFNVLRPYLDHQDVKVKAEAARVLSADASSRPQIVNLIVNRETAEPVRVQALRGMGRFDEKFSSYAIPMIRNPEVPGVVRQAAMTSMVGQVNYKKLPEPVEIEFAQAVESFATDPNVTAADEANLRKLAAATLQNLQKSSPAIKRHYEKK
jgi:hypothetical protein